jgi:exo-1,4-beta-D-glucosaminidase
MFEAYSRNKYNSTGLVQWMLNSAWPSNMWHLYDYYLQSGGSYFGVKKALSQPLHLLYSYDVPPTPAPPPTPPADITHCVLVLQTDTSEDEYRSAPTKSAQVACNMRVTYVTCTAA